MKDSFKNKLKQHRPDWDKEAFWAELEPELPQKPRRRFAWWMWMLPAGLIIVSSAAWYSYAQNIQHGYKPSMPITSFAIPVSGDLVTSTTIHSKQQPQAVVLEETTTGSITPTITDQKTNKQNPYQKAEGLAPGLAPLQSVNNTQILEPLLSAHPTILPTQMLKNRSRSRNVAITSQLPLLPIQNLVSSEDELPIALSPELSTKNSAGQWYQIYTLGVAQPTRRFRHATSEIREKKEQEESLREVITADYLIGYRHSSGWYAHAGLELQQRLELLQWQGLVDSSLVNQNINRAYFIYDQNGQPAYQAGELEVTQLTRRFITQQNYYRMVNLPVQLGYEYRHRRWSGFAQAGLHLNLLHRFSGKFIDADNQVQEAATVNQIILRRNLGLGWSAGLGASYHLLPELELFLQADYQEFSRSIYREQEYGQWYGNWGLKVGLRRGL